MNAINQRGVLATIAATIADQEANIINVDIKDKDDRNTKLEFIIEVRDRQHLANVMRSIRVLKHISNISRR
jgi:(p)ppGpp synthase/HD superfamily hydrolase